jgi:hypothetical protein
MVLPDLNNYRPHSTEPQQQLINLSIEKIMSCDDRNHLSRI